MKKENIKLTEKEVELIMAIRNYRRSYPNGHPQLLYYIQQLLDELTDLP
ncbi:ArsR family transcriptional regulator [uncultured Duncaniella sp.]|nr:ArsR family transcriptional regulator [uncultured Duncaniella sp.]